MKKQYTKDPTFLEDLEKNGYLVVGSNKQGAHGSGAARYAYDVLDAKWGIGEGITGRSYMFPTLNYGRTQEKNDPEKFINIDCRLNEFELAEAMINLRNCIENNPDKKFYITKLGLGIAGIDLHIMHKVFWDSGIPFLFDNDRVVYPEEFEGPDEMWPQ